jgi:hypothetical protein
MTAWPILSFNNYSIVAEAMSVVIEAQNCQRALPGNLIGTPSVCQFPNGPSLKVDLQVGLAVGLGFRLMLFYHIYNTDNTPKYT